MDTNFIAIEQYNHFSVGRIALTRGLITSYQILEALKLQHASPSQKFGDVLVQLEAITRYQLHEILAFQQAVLTKINRWKYMPDQILKGMTYFNQSDVFNVQQMKTAEQATHQNFLETNVLEPLCKVLLQNQATTIPTYKALMAKLRLVWYECPSCQRLFRLFWEKPCPEALFCPVCWRQELIQKYPAQSLAKADLNLINESFAKPPVLPGEEIALEKITIPHQLPEFILIYETLKRMEPDHRVGMTRKFSADCRTIRMVFSNMASQFIEYDVVAAASSAAPTSEPTEQTTQPTTPQPSEPTDPTVQTAAHSQPTAAPSTAAPTSQTAQPSAPPTAAPTSQTAKTAAPSQQSSATNLTGAIETTNVADIASNGNTPVDVQQPSEPVGGSKFSYMGSEITMPKEKDKMRILKKDQAYDLLSPKKISASAIHVSPNEKATKRASRIFVVGMLVLIAIFSYILFTPSPQNKNDSTNNPENSSQSSNSTSTQNQTPNTTNASNPTPQPPILSPTSPNIVYTTPSTTLPSTNLPQNNIPTTALDEVAKTKLRAILPKIPTLAKMIEDDLQKFIQDKRVNIYNQSTLSWQQLWRIHVTVKLPPEDGYYATPAIQSKVHNLYVLKEHIERTQKMLQDYIESKKGKITEKSLHELAQNAQATETIQICCALMNELSENKSQIFNGFLSESGE